MLKTVHRVLRSLQTPRPAGRQRSRPTPIDPLEQKILPVANVSFNGAALNITSDTSNNNIRVERVGTELRVAGQGGTLINVLGTNVTEYFFPLGGAFNLTAKFSDGNDQLRVVGGLQLKSANISMGDGIINEVTVHGATLSGKLTINGGNGTNFFVIEQTSVTSSTVINTGWHSDGVTLIDSTFVGATTIKTNLGSDQVTILSTGASRTKFVGKLTIDTGEDADTVLLRGLETKAFSINTGDGGDVVTIEDVLTNGPISVKTGGGVDGLTLTEVIHSGTGAIAIDLGADFDGLFLNTCTFSGATTLNLGGGGTTCLIDDASFNGAFTLTTKGVFDQIRIETNTAATGETTFRKAAVFNLGLQNAVVFGAADAASSTRFLSSVSLTGKNPLSTLTVTVANVSFLSPPILKNVTRIDV